jgi:hypothetical protein
LQTKATTVIGNIAPDELPGIYSVVLQKVFEVIKSSRPKIVYATTPKMSAINFT